MFQGGELLVITCCYFGICGFGINDGNVTNCCFMRFGAHQPINYRWTKMPVSVNKILP